MTVYRIISYSVKYPYIYFRGEYIDTEKNEVFRNCRSKEDVRIAYEDFWRFGDRTSPAKVIYIAQSFEKSKGKNWGIKVLKMKAI